MKTNLPFSPPILRPFLLFVLLLCFFSCKSTSVVQEKKDPSSEATRQGATPAPRSQASSRAASLPGQRGAGLASAPQQRLGRGSPPGRAVAAAQGPLYPRQQANTTIKLPQRPGPDTYRSVEIKGIPHIKQKPDFCGEACVAMYLRKLGRTVDQDFVFDQAGIDPLLGRGAVTRELVRALRRIGFQPGKVWHTLPRKGLKKHLEKQWRALYRDLLAGIPSIVCTYYDSSPNTTEHFRLVWGYDAKKDEILYHEPAEKNGASLRMKRRRFFALWPLKYHKKTRLVIRMRLKAGTLKKTTIATTLTHADYAQEVMKIKKKLPSGFTLVLSPPFLVAGDEAPYRVRQRAQQTVHWAVRHLKKLYFSKNPKHIITIWLFKDKQSYRKYTRLLFQDTPGTPFGYYSSHHRALIMNIATGGGTLVHEIVHPFVAANFPNCPDWFNEGLGSLYEQCGEKNGRIVGFTNWRLAGLQKVIRQKKLPSFRTLLLTNEDQFYNHDPGTNYAQARYLCYYLQQKGLLVKFYRAFYKNRKKDPSGYRTLRKILGSPNMKSFQKKWERWVLQLRFP